MDGIMEYFKSWNTDPKLARLDENFYNLASQLNCQCGGQETEMALRKLLEAKDCLARAYLREQRVERGLGHD
jgi:hypothetical protein